MLGNFAIVGMIENMTKLPDRGQIDVMGASLIGQELSEVRRLRKYIRMLKMLVLAMYLALTLYLLWFYQFGGTNFA